MLEACVYAQCVGHGLVWQTLTTYYTGFITAQRCFLVVLDYKSQLQGHMGSIFHFNYTEAGNFPLANCRHTAQGPSCTYWTLSKTHYFLISLAWCKAALINSFMSTVDPINPYNLRGVLQNYKSRNSAVLLLSLFLLVPCNFTGKAAYTCLAPS